MKAALALRIEAKDLHSSLIESLRIASFMENLDAVQVRLEQICIASNWKVTRGGHHVALNTEGPYGSRRAAIIVEATDADSVFKYNSVRHEVERIEENARAKNQFLRDAPKGSQNLKVAMMEEAIRNVSFQHAHPCYIEGRPVMTTGLSSAVDAALVIANS